MENFFLIGIQRGGRKNKKRPIKRAQKIGLIEDNRCF